MSATTVEVESRGAVAIVTINRPESGNALSLEVGMDLMAAALTCARNPAVRAVVLTGAGKNFCFGGDLRAAAGKGPAIDAYLRELTTYLHSAQSSFVRMDAPVIAAVNGTAAGAGLGLLLTCDLAVCGKASKFVSAYTAAGLTPDAGVSFMLPRVIGARRAMEMMLLNRAVPADEALSWGLVNEVVADGEVVNRAIAIADQLTAGATQAFGSTKRLTAASLGPLERQMTLESETIVGRSSGAEGREGVAAFLEKRKPNFRG